jgi:putative mRNA 3-end processing factor
VRVSYQHANPAAGNESFLLRFRGDGESTPCLLVDAGNGVDVDALTEPDDRLVGICLTHAHLDHYATLAAAHREGVPILLSPATGAILGDVLDVAGTEYGVDSSRAVRDAITPVAEPRELTAEVSVQPVPAGHAPGAVGWLVTVTDGEDTHRLLTTGDFTRRRVAGYPGLPADALPPVDALFLTASTNDRFETALTEALGTALEHAGGGKRTLVAASGLTGVHVAYLLSAIVEQYELRVPVRVVGQAAKLYERLGYDRPGVESIPRFDDPRTCLEHGAVTVAGPEIPRERSSGRMFGLLREDPNGSVIQLVGSGAEPLTDARCTLHDYEIVNHPTRETLTAVHDAVDPTETVMVHAHRGANRSFNDLDSVVWGTGDRAEYTLYDGTGWRLPPWMDGDHVAGESQTFATAVTDAVESVPVPAIGRQTEPDLAAEGVDTDRLADLLHHRQGTATDTASPSVDTASSSTDTASSSTDTASQSVDADDATPRVATDGASATNDTPEETMSDNEETTDGEPDQPTPDGPIRTTGAASDDQPDPAVKRMLEAQDVSPEEFTARMKSARAETTPSEPPGDDTESDSVDDEAETDSVDNDEPGTDSVDSDEPETDSDASDEHDTESDDERDESETDSDASDERDGEEIAPSGDSRPEEADATPETAQTNGAGSEAVSADAGVTTNGSQAASADGTEPSSSAETTATAETAATAGTEPPDDDPPTDTTGGTAARHTATADEGDHPRASALALALAPRAVEETQPEAAVAAALREYLVAVLAGDADAEQPGRLSVGVDATPAVETALAEAAATTDRFADTEALIGAATAAALGVGSEAGGNGTEGGGQDDEYAAPVSLPTARPVPALASYADQLDGVLANDDYGFETETGVVDAAVAWALEHGG